ncbi:hypothetical protein [Streptomyces stackebrandtii]
MESGGWRGRISPTDGAGRPSPTGTTGTGMPGAAPPDDKRYG